MRLRRVTVGTVAGKIPLYTTSCHSVGENLGHQARFNKDTLLHNNEKFPEYGKALYLYATVENGMWGKT